jgi:hypothetical protein
MATTVAATVATTVATAVAAVATAVAAVAAAMAAIAAMATAAAPAEGQSLAVTAHKGNADQREKQRETENNDTIHPQFLQLLTGTGKWTRSDCRQRRSQGEYRRLSSACDLSLQFLTSFQTRSGPCCEFLRVAKDMTITKIRS